MSRHIVLPKAALPDVKSLVQLRSEEISTLGNLFGQPISLEEDAGFTNAVASELGRSPADVADLVFVSQFLLKVVESGIPAQEVLDDLREFVATFGEPEMLAEFDSKQQSLAELLTPKPERSKALKVKYLQSGIGPTVDSFRTVCELRPAFVGPKEKEEIVGYVPAILLQIKSTDADGGTETKTFHMTLKSLESLKTTIARTEQKLESIRSRFGDEFLTD